MTTRPWRRGNKWNLLLEQTFLSRAEQFSVMIGTFLCVLGPCDLSPMVSMCVFLCGLVCACVRGSDAELICVCFSKTFQRVVLCFRFS